MGTDTGVEVEEEGKVLVQSGSDLESFRVESDADIIPCLISRVSRWLRLLDRTCKEKRD